MRSLGPFYTVSYAITWAKTSWTYSTVFPISLDPFYVVTHIYKMDQDFLDTVYTCALILIHRIFEDWGIGWGMGHLNTYNLAIFK